MIGGPLMGALIPSEGYALAGVFAMVVPMIVCLTLMSLAPPVKRRNPMLSGVVANADQ
jgi:hypothetical protein